MGAIFRIGMLAKGDDVVAGNDVLAVGKDKELKRRRLLLAGLVAHVDHDFADALDRRLQDGLHLPDAGVVVAPTGLQEGVDGLFGGRRGGEVGRIGLGKHGRARRGAGAEGSCAGAAGTCCWAAACEHGQGQSNSATTRATALAKRADRRIKLFLLKWREGSRTSSLYLNFDGNGKSAAHAKRL